MKKKIILLFFLLIFCKSRNCIKDEVFINNFNYKLNTLKLEKNEDSIYKIIYYMEKVTQIKSHYHRGDIKGYFREKDKEKDINVWRKWIIKNECSINKRIADSLFLNNKLPFYIENDF